MGGSQKPLVTTGGFFYLEGMEITFEDAAEIARDAHAGQFDKNGVESMTSWRTPPGRSRDC